MRTQIWSLLFVVFSSTAYAGNGSVIGAQPFSGTKHNVALGWPSLSYEWWHAGNPDWALGAELVYGDWVGEFSDVEIGVAFNIPLRWHLHHSGKFDVAFRLKPGVLLGGFETGRNDRFVFGAQGEIGIPVSVDLHPKVNLITGATVPFSVFFVEDADPFFAIPLLGRIGVEFKVSPEISPWLLLELGPAIAVGDFGSDVEFALRVWVGSTFG